MYYLLHIVAKLITFKGSKMPIVRIALPSATTQFQQAEISNSIHEAMVETFSVPLADKFQIITRHSDEDLICTEEFLKVKHTKNVVLVQITCSFGRSIEVKKRLYLKIVEKVAQRTAFLPSDVIINLVETAKENWSFGDGIAHYA
jgi:4-oxalocrotonate tautomerase